MTSENGFFKGGCDLRVYNGQPGHWEPGSGKSSNKINDGESLNRKRQGQYCQRYLENN